MAVYEAKGDPNDQVNADQALAELLDGLCARPATHLTLVRRLPYQTGCFL